MMFKPIHKHLLITTQVDRPITQVPVGKNFLEVLVEVVGMVKVTEPQAYYVKTSGNEGLTGSINLATSHVAFHIWDVDKKLIMDLYSCKDFDPADVIRVIKAYFGGISETQMRLIDRETYVMTEVEV